MTTSVAQPPRGHYLNLAEMYHLQPLLAELPEKVDTRTKEGRVWKRRLAEIAVALKQEGWPITAIAEVLPVDAATVSHYVSMRAYGGGGSSKVWLQKPTHRATEDAGSGYRAYLREQVNEREAQRQANWDAALAELRSGGALSWHLLGDPSVIPGSELAELIKRQERDERFGDSIRRNGAWCVSLDAPSYIAQQYQSDYAAPRHERLADESEDCLDPADVLERREADQQRRDITGDLSEFDVYRLDDDTLDHLRDRLREEGLVTIRVQRSERERLRRPTRHRGSAPPPTWSRMAPRHRGRKAQHTLMAGKRTSRKQAKRWARKAEQW